MAARDLSTWDSWCTSHLRIVLLGGRNSGKSSVGNLILGKEEFVVKERTTCSRRLGVVAGRWLTVVDTPGWWCDFSAQDTAELVRREIVRSISLCSPGPHVFLIVIKMSSVFSGKRQRALEEHLALLGENVWSHSIVLFTDSNWPTRATVEDPIKMGSKALEWLGTKCSQRCHSVIFSRDIVSTRVTELLAKIEKLLTENGNRLFVMEESILQAIAEKKMIVEERAQQRFMKMKKQRAVLQEQLHCLLDIRIVLLGAKGSGKSSAVNTILHNEQSLELRSRTAQCVMRRGPVFGRHVTVIDTPGWWMNYFTTETPMFDQREIVRSPSLCSPGPHVFLLAIRVDRTFTESYRRAVQEHLELISERMWAHAIVLFNFGDWLGETTIEQYIESEGEPLQWLVEKCSNRYHVLNNKTRGDGFQVRELMRKIEEMVSGNSGVHYEMEGTVIQQLEQTMRTDEERVKERLMALQNGRQMARSQCEKLNPLPEMRIVLVGGRNTGKSSSGNTIMGRECFDTENQTTVCDERQGRVRGKTVTVVDTPGWQSVTPDLLRASSAFGLSVILLVVNVSFSFTVSLGEAIAKQLETLGEEAWGRAMVLFSHGDWLGTTTLEQRIESEGDALQRLVERCGNRYHVLDNKNWLDGAQVKELLDKVEEMLAEERLIIFQRGVPIGKNIALKHDGLELDGVTHHKGAFRSHLDQLTHNMNELATVHVQPVTCSRGSDVCGQEVAVPDTVGERKATASLTIMDRHSFMSSMNAMLRGDEGLRSAKEGTQTLVVNLPEWLSTAAYPHSCMRLSQVSPFLPPRRQSLVLVLPFEQPQSKVMEEEREGAIGVHSLCHPTLRERTLKKLATSGGLQSLIDQWGTSNLEELEAFIDYYFEMVWEQTMAAEMAEQDCPATDFLQQDALAEEPGQEVLSSIDKKLSKLNLLEGIQRDMTELKQSLETMRRITHDLCVKSKEDQEPSAPADTEKSKDKD